jgi:8-oxo-dGTP pyrophosphatase MutT (NUDIX family)
MSVVIEEWRRFLTKENKDSSRVTKIVLVNSENKVLFLKRTGYVEKYAGQWDLPGGHVHVGEKLIDGLKRELEEETGLVVPRPSIFTKIENLYFFKGTYERGKIVLSSEHSEYDFIDPMQIQNPSKFEKVAQMVVKNEQY